MDDVMINAEVVSYFGEQSFECEAELDCISVSAMSDGTLILKQSDEYINVGPTQARTLAEVLITFAEGLR